MPRAARKRLTASSAGGVASMTSWPAAPWICTSKNAEAECCTGEVEDARIGRFGSRFAGGNRSYVSIFNDDQRIVVRLRSIPELFRRDHRFHRDDYCRSVPMRDVFAGVLSLCGSRCDCVHGYVTRKQGTFCYRFGMRIRTLFLVTGSVLSVGAPFLAAQSIDLPTSKQLFEPVPGQPQRINSLPMSMAVSPDAHYVVTVNAGYGTYESKYDQSLAVLDTQTGTVVDFPEDSDAGAREADVVLGAGIQPRRKPSLREHRVVERIRWALGRLKMAEQRPGAGCWSMDSARKDRAGAHDSFAAAATRRRAARRS